MCVLMQGRHDGRKASPRAPAWFLYAVNDESRGSRTGGKWLARGPWGPEAPGVLGKRQVPRPPEGSGRQGSCGGRSETVCGSGGAPPTIRRRGEGGQPAGRTGRVEARVVWDMEGVATNARLADGQQQAAPMSANSLPTQPARALALLGLALRTRYQHNPRAPWLGIGLALRTRYNTTRVRLGFALALRAPWLCVGGS